MCGRFTLRTPSNQLVQQFQLDTALQLPLRFNIAPTQEVAVVRLNQADGRELAQLRWGLVPSWAKQPSIGSRMINARAETVHEKPAFRSAFKRRRCLILADGYYEWQKAGKKKQPYYIHMQDGRPFAFAGLWESWRGDKNDESAPSLHTCTIITTTSNDATSAIHDRMPVILDVGDHSRWLDPEIQSRDPIDELLVPYDSAEMIAEPVSTYVNKATNEGPQCVVAQRELF